MHWLNNKRYLTIKVQNIICYTQKSIKKSIIVLANLIYLQPFFASKTDMVSLIIAFLLDTCFKNSDTFILDLGRGV